MNMNVPFKPEYTKIEWEWNDEHLKAWKEGKTGYPIVDAAMRQMNHCKYMHNRPRKSTNPTDPLSPQFEPAR